MESKRFERAEERAPKQAEVRLEGAEADSKGGRTQAAGHEIHGVLREPEQAGSHHYHEIHFRVDGEPEETTAREMTPNAIILEYGRKDPASNYLVRIERGRKIESYEGKGGELIHLHSGMCFQIISTGPTPVSDGSPRTGVAVFIEGLEDLGYSPMMLPRKPDHVVFEYEIQSGNRAGKKVRLGLIVPTDFPMIAPSGPYVSPHIHPINPRNTGHPLGGVHHDEHCGSFETGAGGSWQYWSRPFHGWAESKKSVAVYMAHVWRLWDSQ